MTQVTSEKPNAGFEQIVNQWHDLAMQTWGAAARQVVESDTYVEWANASMDWYLAGLKRTRQAVKLSLEALDLPSGEELARLSGQIQTAEGRVVECEERLDGTESAVVALQRRLEALEQRNAELEKRVAADETAVEKYFEKASTSTIQSSSKKGGTRK
jgi:hypothetical protein